MVAWAFRGLTTKSKGISVLGALANWTNTKPRLPELIPPEGPKTGLASRVGAALLHGLSPRGGCCSRVPPQLQPTVS